MIHVGGIVLGAKLAKHRGWAINLGGGFHHCCDYEGNGFCAYADITLAIKFAFFTCSEWMVEYQYWYQ